MRLIAVVLLVGMLCGAANAQVQGGNVVTFQAFQQFVNQVNSSFGACPAPGGVQECVVGTALGEAPICGSCGGLSGLNFGGNFIPTGDVPPPNGFGVCNVNGVLGSCPASTASFISLQQTLSGPAALNSGGTNNVVTNEVTEVGNSTQTLPACGINNQFYVIWETNNNVGGWAPIFATLPGWSLQYQLGGSAPTPNTTALLTDVYTFQCDLPNKIWRMTAFASAAASGGGGGGVSNPMTSNLNAAGFSITNLFNLVGEPLDGGNIDNFNVNEVYNVAAYGPSTMGNGSYPACNVSDDVYEQQAIDAACAGNGGSNSPTAVYFPTPPVTYQNCNPLFIHCSNISLVGPGKGSNTHPTITQNYSAPTYSPAFVIGSYSNSGTTLGPPLISGSTNSYAFNGVERYYINLNDVAGVPSGTTNAIAGINGLPTGSVTTSNGITLDAYVMLASTAPDASAAILWSGGRYATYTNGTRAAALWISGGKFTGNLTVAGTLYTLTDNTTTIATNTLYDVQLSYDGAHIRLFTNGVLVAVQAATGTVTQPYWEVMTVGAGVVDWPDGPDSTGPINGDIDGVQVSIGTSGVRNPTSSTSVGATIFTPCNCEPTADSSSLVIASNDQNLRNLTRLTGPYNSIWSFVRRGSEDNGHAESELVGIQMQGLSFSSINSPYGIVGQVFNGSTFRDLSFNGTQTGVYEYGTDFENVWDNLYFNQGASGYIGFYVGGQSGLQDISNVTSSGSMVGLRVSDSGINVKTFNEIQEPGTIWAYSIQGDTGNSYFNCTSCGLDAENGGPNWRGTLQLDNLESGTWVGGALDGGTGGADVPAVEIDGGSNEGSFTSVGTNFTASGGPEFVNIANSNLPHGVALIQNPFGIVGSGVSLTNSPADVIMTPSIGYAPVTISGANFSGVQGTVTCTESTFGALNDVNCLLKGFINASTPAALCFGSATSCVIGASSYTCLPQNGTVFSAVPISSFQADFETYQPQYTSQCIEMPPNYGQTAINGQIGAKGQ